MEGGKDGRVERWKRDGRMEEWKGEDWKGGRGILDVLGGYEKKVRIAQKQVHSRTKGV